MQLIRATVCSVLLTMVVADSFADHNCTASRSHRILCPTHAPTEIAMKCDKWAQLVSRLKAIEPERRIKEVMIQIKAIRDEEKRSYAQAYVVDALRFLKEHETEEYQYKNPQHAYAAAMLACGYWESS